MKIRFAVLFVLIGTLASTCPAQTPFQEVLTQYSASWTAQSGYKMQGAQWDPMASYPIAFQLQPPSVQALATSTNGQAQYDFFNGNFQGRLRAWAQQAQVQGLGGGPLVDGTRTFLDSVFSSARAPVAALYPGYPDEVYKALIIQNLAHAFYVYGTSYYYETITGQVVGQSSNLLLQSGQLTAAQELKSLLELTTADCGESAELVRVLGQVWGLDMRYLGIAPDYWSSIARQRVQAGVHAIDILVYANRTGAKNALLVDSVTNMAIAPGPLARLLPAEMVGDGIVAIASSASNRYTALANAGKILGFFDYYMHPPVRSGYLKSSAYDVSLIKFMYSYFLEAYPNPAPSYASFPAWEVNNASYSVHQLLF